MIKFLAALGYSSLIALAGVYAGYSFAQVPAKATPTLKSLLKDDPNLASKACKTWWFTLDHKERKVR